MNQFSQHKTYTATRLTDSVQVDSDWNKSPWNDIEPLQVTEYMGPEPAHKPGVEVKVAYDTQAVYVIFRVEDRFVRSTRTAYQDPVYKDSAVEFFFCPADDSSSGYFNLEINCGGTALFRFKNKDKEKVLIPEELFKQVEIAHSLPEIVDPEIQQPVTWTLEFRLPVSILEQYYDVSRPAPGNKWRVNFYKIADESSHPHYLTWSKVIGPKPNFHLPEYFGTLIFE